MGLIILALLVPAFPLPLPQIHALGLQPHAPILIDDNLGFTLSNGVTGGAGTASDPFVIDGWEISARYSFGIVIRNTDAYFVVRNVYVHSGAQWFDGTSWRSYSGVSLVHANNGRVENSTFSNNNGGIAVYLSRVMISRNSLLNNTAGITFYTTNTVVSDNFVSGNGIGIEPGGSNITIEGNHITSNYQGIATCSSSTTSILHNEIAHNAFGIYLCGTSYDQTLSIYENDIHDNSAGIVLDGELGVVVKHNNFVSNNHVADDEDEDGVGGMNFWDGGYPDGGNFWSDYSGVDKCSGPNQDICTGPDGLGDTARVIDFDSEDHYPLTKPFADTISAEVGFYPSTILLESRAKYLSAYIRLPVGFTLSNVIPSSIRLNSTILLASSGHVQTQWQGADGSRVIRVEFSLQGVKAVFPGPGTYSLRISGNIVLGASFAQFAGNSAVNVATAYPLARHPEVDRLG